ncbi:MAG TPA: foldase [Desulfosporosinus sp.]|nr:foldase [Desulfosporosinus sp.]
MIFKSIKTIYVGLFTFLLVVGIGIGSVYATQNNIVAKVNGVAITETELQDLLLQQGGSEALDSLIQQSIIKQESEKQSIQVSEADIDTELATVKASFDSEDAFNQALETSGMTLDDLRKNILTNIQIIRLLEAETPITEEEIQLYFETNKDTLGVAEEVKASHILVETEELANEVKAKIVAGEDFAELAKQYSTDESTKELGGDLGFFAKGDMVQEFEEVAFSLEVGIVSAPVKTEYGYHIIKIEDKTEAKVATLEDSTAKIKAALLEEKLDTEFDPWLQERLTEYTIENYLTKN